MNKTESSEKYDHYFQLPKTIKRNNKIQDLRFLDVYESGFYSLSTKLISK